MPLDDPNRDKDDRILSDGESTPNSIGPWLVIGIILAVIYSFFSEPKATGFAPLLAFFGVIILAILAVGKFADWASGKPDHAVQPTDAPTPQPPENEKRSSSAEH